MSLDRDIALMQQVPLFSHFRDDQLRLLAFSAESRVLQGGTVLFRQGDPAESGYLIASGTLVLTREAHKTPAFSEEFGPGTLVGEMALLVESRRGATATALGRCELVQIRRALFRRVLNEYPDLAKTLYIDFQDRITKLAHGLRPVGDLLTSLDD